MSRDLCEGFTCIWKIDVSSIYSKPRVGICFESFAFNIDILRDTEWKFELELEDDRETFNLDIFKVDCGNFKMDYTISLLTDNFGSRLIQPYRREKFIGDGNSKTTTLFMWEDADYVRYNYLYQDFLIIRVHMFNNIMNNQYSHCLMISETRSNGWMQNISIQYLDVEELIYLFPNLKEKKISASARYTQTDSERDYDIFKDVDDLLNLFKEKKFSYVTLRTEKKDFAVHKAVLCARSPVFNAMFERNLKENESNVVQIDDIESDILSLLLKFLHMEPLKDLTWDIAIKLYYAADKYQIEPLRKECAHFLKKEMSVENICEVYLLASMHQDVNLKQSALEYFSKNSSSVLLSSGWKDLMMKKAEIEILCGLANDCKK